MQGTMVSSPPPVQRQQNLQVRNYMKKWSSEDDDKLIEILNKTNKEPDVVLRPPQHDVDIQNMFGRSANAIKCRLKLLIYKNYDEDKWDALCINNGITKYDFAMFLQKQKFIEENKKDKKDKIIDELKEEVKKLKNEIKELKHENNLMKCHRIYCGEFPEEV